MRRLLYTWAVICLCTALLLPFPVAAQHLGSVQQETVQAGLATGTTCTGSAQTFSTANTALNALGFRNLGQISHQASAISAAAALAMEIDGIDNVGTSMRISNGPVAFANSGQTSYIVQGSGYYPNVQVSVTCTAGATFSLSYTGSSAAPTTIVGAPGGNTVTLNGSLSNVQGIVPSGQNGLPIYPVIAGGVQQAINANFLNVGLDNFGIASAFQPFVSGGTNAAFTFTPPVPTNTGEYGLVFFFNSQIGGATNTFVGNGWTCIEASCTQNGGGFPVPAQKSLVSNSTNSLAWSYTGANGPATVLAAFLELTNPPVVRQHVAQNGAGTTLAMASTLQGGVLIYAVSCQLSPCSFSNVTDTQGLRWRLVETSIIGGGFTPTGGLAVFMSRDPATAAAETITVTPAAGVTISGSYALELTGVLPSTLTTPSTPVLTDSRGGLVPGNVAGVTDPCQTAGALKQSVPISISTVTTTQLIPLDANQVIYPCGGYVEIAASSGAATATIQFEYGTGANCGTGTTVLTGTMGTGTVTTSFAAQPIPLSGSVANWNIPASNALCAVTAGTSVSAQGWLTYVKQ